ncbi:hypothetical protein LN042_08575 [Kitasatospora sp. RB6PN24]|uniref:hypothetical protein n=1 Tax=Kitasatospora humi TaxID=2893891 RepID=UPI001E471075|nr:hypothetical protein [Kitasatospora humi]MCC9307154.1 hypothetical protein [Kitasatospora humi]
METGTYRMIVTSGYDYVASGARADELLRRRLGEQRGHPTAAIGQGRTAPAPGVLLDADSAVGRDGAHTRWRLREPAGTGPGLRQTTLVIRTRADGAQPWICLEVEHLPGRTAGGDDDPPELAAALLTGLAARDGASAVRAEPAVVATADVGRVVAELCDGARRLPVVVDAAAAGASERALWRPLVGLAVLYRLTSEAVPAFNRALPHHRIAAGGVRTFLPGLDPASPVDGYRHPAVHPHGRHPDPAHTAAAVARLPRRLAARAPLPAELAALPPLRTRPRPSGAGTFAPASPDGPGLAQLRADQEVLTALLEEADHEEAARRAEIGQLRLELREQQEYALGLAVELAERADELRRTEGWLRHLQQHLAGLGEAAEAYRAPEAEPPGPTGFAALLERLGELPALRFTGNRRITVGLDAQALGEDWAATAWDALLALQDYAAARRSGAAWRDFLHWCRQPPPGGHRFPPGKVVRDESAQTAGRPVWRRQRTFPVPTEVDPAGEVFMGAHLRIGAGNGKAPRLHFHDDTARSGLVYLGYLGPHLDNTLKAGI